MAYHTFHDYYLVSRKSRNKHLRICYTGPISFLLPICEREKNQCGMLKGKHHLLQRILIIWRSWWADILRSPWCFWAQSGKLISSMSCKNLSMIISGTSWKKQIFAKMTRHPFMCSAQVHTEATMGYLGPPSLHPLAIECYRPQPQNTWAEPNHELANMRRGPQVFTNL